MEKYIKHLNSFGSQSEIEYLVKKYSLPIDYVAFMQKNGTFEFSEEMLVIVNGKEYSVDTFLNTAQINALINHAELPASFFPVAENDLGLVGINIANHTLEYLYTDRTVSEKPILLSRSFNEFIGLICKEIEPTDDTRKITDVQISDEFLQLLKNRK